MSAIAGLLNFRNAALNQESLVDNMLSSMKHRYSENPAVKGIGPLTMGLGPFPVTREELIISAPFLKERYALVLDGRLDNRRELINNLDISQPEISDHELFLAAYLKWGEQCVERISGDFSFALWNGGMLFCGRDRFGVKPFFYFKGKDFFLFASEAKAILASGLVKRQINEEYAALHFVPELLVNDLQNSIYMDIQRLPPAHTISVNETSVSRRCYWKLEPGETGGYKKDSDYYERLRELFYRSVAERMRSSGEVGTALSGGLDSTAVTCAAREYKKAANLGPLHTFSCLFGSSSNEKEWIDSVIEEGGLIPHFIFSDEYSPLDDIEDILRLHEGPYLGGNGELVYSQFRAARRQGIRVYLDGEDGDGTLSHGYDRFVQLAQAGDWHRFFSEADGVSESFGKEIFNYSRAGSFDKYALPYLQSSLHRGRYFQLFNDIKSIHRVTNVSRKKLMRHILKGNPGLKDEDFSLIRKEVVRKYHLQDRLRDIRSKSCIRRYPASDNMLHSLDFAYSGNAYILEHADRVSSFFGIELRHPFFSHELAEFALSIPSSLKLNGGLTRAHFRKAMEGIVPDKVRLRGGKGDLSFQAYERYRRYCQERIDRNLSTFSEDDPLLNRDEVEKIRRQYISEGKDSLLMDVWGIYIYNLWQKQLPGSE